MVELRPSKPLVAGSSPVSRCVTRPSARIGYKWLVFFAVDDGEFRM